MNLNNHTITFIKRQAKNFKKELKITHTEALEVAAKKAGFQSWIHCLRILSKKDGIIVKKNPAETTRNISFTDWLVKHKNRNSPLGDLAADMLRDNQWPKDYSTLDQFIGYLESIRAHSEAISTLKSAWKTYKAYLKRKLSALPSTSEVDKNLSKYENSRKIVFLKNIKPLHFSKRKVEKFDIGDKAWVSWNGSKAIPVIILEVDDRYYTFRKERPLTDNKLPYYVRLDEVGSTPELACRNHVTS